MRKRRRAACFLIAVWFAASHLLFAEVVSQTKEQPAGGEEKQMVFLKNQEMNMKINSLEREMSDLSRRLDRIEDHIERIDRDVKDLKFR